MKPDQIFKKWADSVVVVTHDKALGSGFFIDHDVVITNHHVIDDANDSLAITMRSGAKFRAKVIVSDKTRDIAALKIFGKASGKKVRVEGARTLTVGEKLVAIGAPKGLDWTLTDGLVSAFREENERDWVQISVLGAPGSSGCPVFDAAGRVVGIITMKYREFEAMLMIPGCDVTKFIQTVKK